MSFTATQKEILSAAYLYAEQNSWAAIGDNTVHLLANLDPTNVDGNDFLKVTLIPTPHGKTLASAMIVNHPFSTDNNVVEAIEEAIINSADEFNAFVKRAHANAALLFPLTMTAVKN